MNLTPPQKQTLKIYRKWKDSPPTLAGFFLDNWRKYAILILLSAGAITLYWLLDYVALAYLVVGMLGGALLRDCALAGQTVRIWPVVIEITNWDRVETLLDEAEQTNPSFDGP